MLAFIYSFTRKEEQTPRYGVYYVDKPALSQQLMEETGIDINTVLSGAGDKYRGVVNVLPLEAEVKTPPNMV